MDRIDTDTGSTKSTKGRKDKNAPPAVIDVTKIKSDLPKLKKLLEDKDDATEDYNKAVTKTAEKAGILSSVLNKAVKAYAGDSFEEKAREVEQLALVFEEVAKV